MKSAISPNTSMDGVKLKPPNMKKPIYYYYSCYVVSPSSFFLASET